VAKVQKKYSRKDDIEDVVKEIAIGKLCSVLGIGPPVKTSIPFDVIVYPDAVQFHLKECERVSSKLLF
jgi:hypothetical protein